VPGETVVFSAMIENRTSFRLKSINVRLVQTIRFHASKIRSITQKVAKIEFQRNYIETKSQDRWDNECLVVPLTCSTLNGLCHIIDVNYFLQLNYYADSPDCSSYSGILIPITIVTMALMNATNANDGMQRLDDGINHNYPQCSYEACSFDDDENNNNKDLPPAYDALAGEMIESNANTFKPQYPYYRNFSKEYPSF
jgi:hypothetical protein